MLKGEWPEDPSMGGGDIPCPMMELFGKRLNEALATPAALVAHQ